jgi:hypothetical protein
MRITALTLALLLLAASFYSASQQRVLNAQRAVIAQQDVVIESQKIVIASYEATTGLLKKTQDKCADALLGMAKVIQLATKPKGDTK